jgi:hypothetical protein
VNLHCLSVRFAPATAKLFSQVYELQVSAWDSDPANGEVGLAPPEVPYTHGGYLRLLDPILLEAMYLPFVVDLPLLADANQNRIPDFFEVNRSLNTTTTSGGYENPLFGPSDLLATWSRAAGSKNGLCRLQLPDLGLTFDHAFEIIQFQGQLTYTNAGANLSGLVTLAQTIKPENTLTGNIIAQLVDADHLLLGTNTLVNAQESAITFEPMEPLTRTGTNYVAYVVADDGFAATGASGYYEWLLLITDAKDSNANGIPDFSDPASPPAKPPTLAIRLQDKSLLLTIQGEVGRAYEVENRVSLGQGAWSSQAAVTLTNATQDVALALPSGLTTFWRVKAP